MASQEQNQLLLNAIKNKFSAKSTEGVSNCSTGFLIPTLKTNAKTDGEGTLKNFTIPSLNCVQGERLKGGTPTTVGSIGMKFTLPALRTSTDENKCSIQKLTTRLEELNVNKEHLSFYGTENKFSATSTKIDLTTALSAPNEIQHHRKSETVKVEQFDIPFIECDQRVKKKKEAKNTKHQPVKTKNLSIDEPSAFGRLMSLRYGDTECLNATINHEFEVKYKIEPFKFDTKSPDDIVMSMLNKIPRRT